ncbi:MAG TPA: hypothetical protein VJK71_07295, partial [Gemmatimonadales bacterium]|nr:hypothetical protein [Gemmatimonadales bacterium]
LSLLPDIPPEVSSTIHQALRKDPARRLGSMNAFARSLQGEPVAPEEGGRVKRKAARFGIPLRKRGWLAVAIWTTVLVVGTYGARRAGLFRWPSSPPPASVTEPTVTSPPPAAPSGVQVRRTTAPGRSPNRPSAGAPRDSSPMIAGTPARPVPTCDEAMRLGEWTVAFERCRFEADSNSSSAARRNLGILYAEGKGVTRNDRLASVHLQLAAQDQELPDTQAVVLMARRWDAGLGVSADRNRGAGLWELAAEMGIEEAWPIIADRYAVGDGRRKNEAAAARWYEKAATAGHVPSMVHLAQLFDRGQGIKRDENAAVKWYNAAAERRDPEGEYQIATRLLSGKGAFARDEATGMLWLRRAAAQGHPEAARELARRGG